jgi:hypothetical protein
MAKDEREVADGAHGADVARLPVPLADRRPAPRHSGIALPDSAAALVRAVSGAPLAAPVIAGAVVGATAAAVMSGVAAASQWMRPWLTGAPVVPAAPSSASWLGPGVHISYTHIEMHWPLGR